MGHQPKPGSVDCKAMLGTAGGGGVIFLAGHVFLRQLEQKVGVDDIDFHVLLVGGLVLEGNF